MWRGIAPVAPIVAVLASGPWLACKGEQPVAGPEPTAAASPAPPAGPLDVAVFRIKDFGEIRIELLKHKTPQTVENFEKLAESGYYEGTTFHRVIPGFMIQGGDPNSKDRDPRNDGRGGPGYTIPDELSDVRHVRGVLSMANRGPNTGGSQFFILVDAAPHLDGRHAAFGRVTEGMEVVDRIVRVERDIYGRWGPRDRPRENVVVESIGIERPKRTRERRRLRAGKRCIRRTRATRPLRRIGEAARGMRPA